MVLSHRQLQHALLDDNLVFRADRIAHLPGGIFGQSLPWARQRQSRAAAARLRADYGPPAAMITWPTSHVIDRYRLSRLRAEVADRLRTAEPTPQSIG